MANIQNSRQTLLVPGQIYADKVGQDGPDNLALSKKAFIYENVFDRCINVVMAQGDVNDDVTASAITSAMRLIGVHYTPRLDFANSFKDGDPARSNILATTSGQTLGLIGFSPCIDSSFTNIQPSNGSPSVSAFIAGVATENASSGARGGKIVFGTTPNGSASVADRVTIDQNGRTILDPQTIAAPSFQGTALDARCNTNGGFVASFFNDGNNQSRHGLYVQGGADDGSGETYYLQAADGDGTTVGLIQNSAGVFSLVDVSDENLKQDIAPTEVVGLDVLKDINVCEFRYTKCPDTLHEAGFIAQNMKEIFPAAVSELPNGTLGISRTALIPVLVKAIQELTARVIELEAKQNG